MKQKLLKLLAKVINSTWYLIISQMLLFVFTLISTGLGMALLLILFVFWGIAKQNDLFEIEKKKTTG